MGSVCSHGLVCDAGGFGYESHMESQSMVDPNASELQWIAECLAKAGEISTEYVPGGGAASVDALDALLGDVA